MLRSLVAAVRRVSLRHFATHRRRTAMTIGGIALGVATMVGLRLLHESVAASYERTVERLAGKSVLQVTNGEVGVAEELLDEVRAVPGVRAAAATVQGFVPTIAPADERLYLIGIDLLAEDELRDYDTSAGEEAIADPLAFLAQPDSVALTRAFAEQAGLGIDSELTVRAVGGERRLVVRALLEVDRGPASLFDGRVAIMDVFAAQMLFGRERRFSQIDIAAEPGIAVDALAERVVAVVRGRAQVERPEQRGAMLERLLGANRYALNVAGMMACVVGLYLIFNTMTIAVAERRRELAVLRALGLERRALLGAVVLEAALLGAIGSLLGVPLGLALARGMTASFTVNVSTMYVPIETPPIRLDVGAVVLGLSLGVLSAVIAAWLPARQAARIHPLEALRPPAGALDRAAGYARLAMLGLVIAAVAMAAWLGRGQLPAEAPSLGALTILGLLVGTSLAVPAAVRAFALRAEPVLARLLGVVGALAARSIVANIGRVAITGSAFLVSLAGAIAMSSLLSSLQLTLKSWLDVTFSGVDLVISAAANPMAMDAPALPGSLVEEIGALPGVRRVDGVRLARVAYQDRIVAVAALDTRLHAAGDRAVEILAGDGPSAYAAAAAHRGVIVNDAFRIRFGKTIGDEVRFAAVGGEVALPIVAVMFDPAFGDLGIVLLDRRLYRELWRDDTVNFVEPLLDEGADREAVADEVRRRFGERHGLFVFTMDRFRGEAETLLGQMMSLMYPLVVISIAIALIGVVNSLYASVLDRVREIGLLRAVGATRGQVARIVVVEATLIGVLGGGLAAALGSILGAVQVEVVLRGMFAMTTLYRHPTEAVVFALLAAAPLAALAGYLPGRAAARLPILDALEEE